MGRVGRKSRMTERDPSGLQWTGRHHKLVGRGCLKRKPRLKGEEEEEPSV